MSPEISQAKVLSEALNRINVTLHSTLDFREIAQRMLGEGTDALGCETAGIMLRENNGWQVGAVYRMPEGIVGTPISDQEIQHTLRAIQQGNMVAVDDAKNDPNANQALLHQYNIRALLLAPLIVRNDTIGIMFFNYHADPHAFTGAEITFVKQLAATASIALDNARLFEEHLQAEKALRASEQRLQLALDAAGMGMWDWDMLTDRVVWNEQHFVLFGIDPNVFSNQASEVFAAIHPGDMARVKTILEQASAQQEPFYIEFRVIHPDESVHWIATQGQRVKGAPNEPLRMIGICFDITDRKQADHQRERYLHQENIAQLHRLQVAGEFAALLAHQLNQPLSAIRSFAEAGLARLRHASDTPEKSAQALKDIVAQSERAAQSIRDLRQFLARQPQEMMPADLNAHIRSASSLMSLLARSHAIRVMLDLDKDLPMAPMRPAQIEQVLINLMENAIDAIRHQAPASSLGTDTMGGEINGTIRISTRFDQEYGELIVTVHDSGPGFDAETAKRVFDPLYTTKKNGIGLGLTISRSLIEDHGGRIWAEAGSGGCFKFTVPVSTT